MSAEPSTDGKRNPFKDRLNIQMEHTITENVIFVNIDRRAPPGYTLLSPWPAILREYFEPLLYPHIGRRENIRPKSVMLREYTERCSYGPKFVLDKYIRIGNHYICSRSYNNARADRTETMTMEMRVSDELRQEIIAGAMRPKRLEKWLEKGWEEEWHQYFSR
jgi:hypothetical protein